MLGLRIFICTWSLLLFGEICACWVIINISVYLPHVLTKVLLESIRQEMYFKSSCRAFIYTSSQTLACIQVEVFIYSNWGVWPLRWWTYQKRDLESKWFYSLFLLDSSIGPTLLYMDGRHANTDLFNLEIANQVLWDYVNYSYVYILVILGYGIIIYCVLIAKTHVHKT